MDLFFNSHDKTSRKFRNVRFRVQDSFGDASKADDEVSCRLTYTTRHRLSTLRAEKARFESILVSLEVLSLLSHLDRCVSQIPAEMSLGPPRSCSGHQALMRTAREPTEAESRRDRGVVAGARRPAQSRLAARLPRVWS